MRWNGCATRRYTENVSVIGSFKAPYYSMIYPTKESWGAGDHTYKCLATSETTDDLFTGSVLSSK